MSNRPSDAAGLHAASPGERGEAFLNARGRVAAGWRTCLASMLCLIVGPSTIASLCYGVFAPYLRRAFGWSVGEIGWGTTISEVTVTIASIGSGLLLDRFGSRRLILICAPLFGLSFAAMSMLSGALWQFYLAWVLLPVVGVGLWPGAWVRATATWFERRLGFAVAIATMGIGLGAAIMPVVVDAIAAARGWRAAYALVGLGSVAVILPLAAAFVRDAPSSIVPRHTRDAIGTPPLPWRDPALWMLCGAFICLGAYSSIVLVNLVLVLEGGGMRSSAAVGAMSTLGLATIGGRLLCGWLLDRLAMRLLMPAVVLPAAVAVAALALGARGALVYPCAALMGMLVGAEVDVLGYSVKRLFDPARFGTIFSIVFAAFHLGGAGGALAMGAGHDRTGSFAPGLWSAVAACAVAALLFALMPRNRRPDALG